MSGAVAAGEPGKPNTARAGLGPPVAASWVYRPADPGLAQRVGGHTVSAPDVACPFPGMHLRTFHPLPPPQPQPLTPLAQASVGSAPTPQAALFRTPTQPLQPECSFATSGMVSALSSAATPVAAGAGPSRPSPASGRVAGETVLPSADEVQLHSLISRLRVALDGKAAEVAALAEQLEAAQRQLLACDVERRGLQLALLEGGVAAAAAPGAASLSPSGRLLQELRHELGREVQGAAEARAERDALRLQVAALQAQLEATAQADAQEQERLAMEAAQSRLLCRARARQIEQLQAQLEAVAAAQSGKEGQAAARVEAAEADAMAARGEAEEARSRAAAAEVAAAAAEQGAAAAQQAAAHADARCTALQTEVSDLKNHADWQAQRIEELQGSAAGQLIRKYDFEVQQLRAEFEQERRQLQAALAQARAGQAAPAVAAPDTPGGWEDLFDEEVSLRAPDTMDAAAQTEAESQQEATPAADRQLLEAAEAEVGRLRHEHAVLLNSQREAQERLAAALARQQHMVGPTERDAAVQQAVAMERAMAAESLQRTEAAWRERLGVLDRQLRHQSAEVQALRAANEKLELAVGTLKEELATARSSQNSVESLQQALARREQELQGAREQVAECNVQLDELRRALERQQGQHALELQQLKSEGMVEAAEAVAAAVAGVEQQYNCELERLGQQLQDSQSSLASTVEELRSLQQQQAQQAMTCDSTVQAGVPGADVAVQTDEAAWPPVRHPQPEAPDASPLRPIGARELQAELARVTITPSRLPIRRAAPPPMGSGQPATGLPRRLPSDPAPSPSWGKAQDWGSPGSGSKSPAASAYGTPADTPAAMSVGPTSAGGALQLLPEVQPLADISAHPTFEAEAASHASLSDSDEDGYRCVTPSVSAFPAASPPPRQPMGALSPPPSFGRCSNQVEDPQPSGSRWSAAAARVPRLPLQSIRPPSTLSQSSLLDSPLQRLGTSLSCSSFGSLRSPPAPAASPPAAVFTGSTLGGSRGSRPVGGDAAAAGGALLADILNLKRSLERPPAPCSERPGGTQWAPPAGSSMQSLDASLQRLARLTGGLASK